MKKIDFSLIHDRWNWNEIDAKTIEDVFIGIIEGVPGVSEIKRRSCEELHDYKIYFKFKGDKRVESGEHLIRYRSRLGSEYLFVDAEILRRFPKAVLEKLIKAFPEGWGEDISVPDIYSPALASYTGIVAEEQRLASVPKSGLAYRFTGPGITLEQIAALGEKEDV